MEFVEAHLEKTWNWYNLSRNELGKHPFFKKLPQITDQQRAILDELHMVFDMPLDISTKPIFKKGGFGFWEGWEDCKGVY